MLDEVNNDLLLFTLVTFSNSEENMEIDIVAATQQATQEKEHDIQAANELEKQKVLVNYLQVSGGIERENETLKFREICLVKCCQQILYILLVIFCYFL